MARWPDEAPGYGLHRIVRPGPLRELRLPTPIPGGLGGDTRAQPGRPHRRRQRDRPYARNHPTRKIIRRRRAASMPKEYGSGSPRRTCSRSLSSPVNLYNLDSHRGSLRFGDESSRAFCVALVASGCGFRGLSAAPASGCFFAVVVVSASDSTCIETESRPREDLSRPRG